MVVGSYGEDFESRLASHECACGGPLVVVLVADDDGPPWGGCESCLELIVAELNALGTEHTIGQLQPNAQA